MKKLFKIKKYIIVFFFIILFLFNFINSYAHSGRTDSSGGHYNRSTGEYHYHHGYSAHQHPNGICPYINAYNDNIIETPSYTSKTSSTTKTKTSTKKDTSNFWKIFSISLAFLILGFPIIFSFLCTLTDSFKRFFSKRNISTQKEIAEIPKKENTNTSKKYICPKCGEKLIIKTGRYGKFIGCSNYPICHYTKNFKNKK